MKGIQQFLRQKYFDQLGCAVLFARGPLSLSHSLSSRNEKIFAIPAWPGFNVSGGRGSTAAVASAWGAWQAGQQLLQPSPGQHQKRSGCADGKRGGIKTRGKICMENEKKTGRNDD